AYVPGLELTTSVPDAELPETREQQEGAAKRLGSLVRSLSSKKTQQHPEDGATADKARGPAAAAEPPDVVGLCDELLQIAFERGPPMCTSIRRRKSSSIAPAEPATNSHGESHPSRQSSMDTDSAMAITSLSPVCAGAASWLIRIIRGAESRWGAM